MDFIGQVQQNFNLSPSPTFIDSKKNKNRLEKATSEEAINYRHNAVKQLASWADENIEEMNIEDHEFESHEDETDIDQVQDIEFNTDDVRNPSGGLNMDRSEDTMKD